MKSFRDEAFLYYDFKPKPITKRPKQVARKCSKQLLSSFSPSSILAEKPSNQSPLYSLQTAPRRSVAPRLELLGHSFLNLESDLCEMQRAAK